MIPVMTAIVLVEYDASNDHLPVYGRLEVEVLTVHFAKNTMRVRYLADLFGEGRMETRTVDMPADQFFAQYRVLAK